MLLEAARAAVNKTSQVSSNLYADAQRVLAGTWERAAVRLPSRDNVKQWFQTNKTMLTWIFLIAFVFPVIIGVGVVLSWLTR